MVFIDVPTWCSYVCSLNIGPPKKLATVISPTKPRVFGVIQASLMKYEVPPVPPLYALGGSDSLHVYFHIPVQSQQRGRSSNPMQMSCDTVDGCEILHQLIDSLSMFIPLFIGIQPSFWWCRISSIHSIELKYG